MRGNLLNRPGLTILVALGVLFSLLAVGAPSPATAAASDVADGVLVRLPAATLRSMGPEAGATIAEAENNVEDLGFGWVLVEGDPDDPAVQAQVAALGEVSAPNTIYELLEDPLFPDQWNLENTGQEGGTVDADVDAPEAWAITEGDASQIVAVIDSGVDLDHPDIVDRLWTNTNEIAGNGIDDDSNGFIDDVSGWDFYGDGTNDDNNPDDQTWHGTAVAGTVAATRNDVGIAGVAPATTIMPIRVCLYSCPLSMIVSGIDYAIANGAGIINLSLGTTTFDQPLADAVIAANNAGVVVVTAAGNSGADIDTNPMYPASLDTGNIISVAATDRFDDLAVFSSGSSSFGATSVDLAAPGKDLLLATLNGAWTTNSGTSFASPMVAGAAALVRAVQPSADPATVKQILLDTVDVLPSLTGKMVTGGRLNAAAAAIAAVPNQAPNAVATAAPTSGTVPFAVNLDATGSTDPDGTILSWEWTDGTQTASGETATMDFTTPGTHTVTLTVTDNNGATGTDTIEITANEPPNVAPAAGFTSLCTDLDCGFTDTSTDTDGSIDSWDWSFGDGTTSTEQNPTHTYTSSGDYIVALTVADNDGATNTDTITITANEPAPAPVERVAGSNRYETSAMLSADTTSPGVPVVYVATGTDFPDGLVAAAAAGQAGGAMLLVKPDSIPTSIKNELDRLDPASIVIAGGTAAISTNVETALAGYSPSVTRLAGANRYETAALVSKSAFPGGTDVVYVTTGQSFPDTLSAVPPAASTNGPVLLVESTAIPTATRTEIVRLNPSQIVVVGGPVPISSALDNQLAAINGATVIRRYGPDRYATSAAISEATFSPGVPVVYIATGTNFPDGLGGAAAGAIQGGPLLLTKPNSLPSSVATELRRLDPQRVVIVGGTAAITTNVQTQITTALDAP